MLAGKFVLENSDGQVVRTFQLEDGQLNLIYRQDSRRLELIDDVKTLKEQNIPFELIKKVTAKGLRRRSVQLENGAILKWVEEVGQTVPLVQVPEDSEEEEKKIYKWTALTQIGAMIFIFIVGLLIEPLFIHKEKEAIVTVIPQEMIQHHKKITVRAAQHKIVHHKHYAKHRVRSPIKHARKVVKTHARSRHHRNAVLRTKVRVDKVGALGVLGGMHHGSHNSAGFNVHTNRDSKGSSWSGIGSAGSGGVERAIHGKGLVAGTPGRGGRIQAGGGYGTRGRAGGGRPGYGDMNIGGTAASYFQPLEQEALVEGGLEKDQIAAVINRHLGEVIYCYERGLQVNPRLAGRVGIRFVINAIGAVSSAAIADSSLHSQNVEGCIVHHLRGWKFPHPVGGVNVKVTYPFVLKRVSKG